MLVIMHFVDLKCVALSTTINELTDIPMEPSQGGIMPVVPKVSAIKLYSSVLVKFRCMIVWVCWALRNHTRIKLKLSLSNSAE